MALTPFRWLALLVAACLIGAMGVLHVEPAARPSRFYVDTLEARLGDYRSQAREAARRLRLAQVLDSVHAGSGAGVTAPVRVLLGASVPVAARAPLESLASLALRNVKDAGVMGLDVFALYDTVRLSGTATMAYAGTIDYVLPRTASERCAVLFRFGKEPTVASMIRSIFNSEQSVQQLLGPCAYYRAFGMPGPQIATWLHTRAWAFAGDGSWSQPAPMMQAPKFNPFQTAIAFDTPLLMMSVEGAHCAAKVPGACAPIVFGKGGGFIYFGDNILHAPYGLLGRSRFSYNPRALGVRESFIFADMVRQLGRERFARFWTSTESPQVAFESAAGESIESWASRWAAAQYGPLPPNGPVMSARAAVISLILVTLSVIGALRISAQRQFT